MGRGSPALSRTSLPRNPEPIVCGGEASDLKKKTRSILNNIFEDPRAHCGGGEAATLKITARSAEMFSGNGSMYFFDDAVIGEV